MASLPLRLREWNRTEAATPWRGVHELFEAQAMLGPDASALRHGATALTYGELNRRANQLARHLRERGVGPDVLVGICMPRCAELVIAVLATLKAGGAYVPLDPTYPPPRLAGMFADVPLAVVLTTDESRTRVPADHPAVVRVDGQWRDIAGPDLGDLPPRANPEHLAYVIFTSGSTGRPKAAGVEHRGWTNLMHWFARELSVTPADRALVISSFSFDITQRALVMPLIRGAELHLAASRVFDPLATRRTIAEQRITLLNCSPSMFGLMLERADPADLAALGLLRVLILGGEPIPAARLRPWAEGAGRATDVVNVYGVAECTDVSTFHRLHDYARYVSGSVPIGRPIDNTQVYLLDERREPVAVGDVGELYIGGAGVGRGYVNDAAATAERFVADPFSHAPGARLYRTGDLARLAPDWTLEFVGRADFQVKVSGQRIDPGDIETALREHPAVADAVVTSRQTAAGEHRLAAHVVPRRPRDRERLPAELRAFLRARLPAYMVPTAFVLLRELPLNPNGKIDRHALRERS